MSIKKHLKKISDDALKQYNEYCEHRRKVKDEYRRGLREGEIQEAYKKGQDKAKEPSLTSKLIKQVLNPPKKKNKLTVDDKKKKQSEGRIW